MRPELEILYKLPQEQLTIFETQFMKDGQMDPIAVAFLKHVDPKTIHVIPGARNDAYDLRAKAMISFGKVIPELTLGMWVEENDNDSTVVRHLTVDGLGTSTGKHDLVYYTGDPHFDTLNLNIDRLDANPEYVRWLWDVLGEIIAMPQDPAYVITS